MAERAPIDPALRSFLAEQAAAFPEPITTPQEARRRTRLALESREIPGLPNSVRTEDHYLTKHDDGGLIVRVYIPNNK